MIKVDNEKCLRESLEHGLKREEEWFGEHARLPRSMEHDANHMAWPESKPNGQEKVEIIINRDDY